MSKRYMQSIETIFEDIKGSRSGLTTKEVKERESTYGLNKLDEGKKQTILEVFFSQFKDFLVIILIAAATISGALGKWESTLVIVIVLILNAVLGTVQHAKAEQSLDSLKALTSPITKVMRDGSKIEIPTEELTIGDVVIVEAGDYIGADARVIESYSLHVNESSLTGESDSVNKTNEVIHTENLPIGDRINMVYSGSFCTYGRGVAVVTDIGMSTEIGKIANLLENAKEKKTPLQVSLDNFGQKLAVIILIICAIVFGLNIFRGGELVDSFMFAVSLAVAAIPEALSSIVTIVLALGTQKMAKENAIVRKLHAIESLGCISVICSDKTGTLTQNKMSVKKVFVNEGVIDYDKLDHDVDIQRILVEMALLCNDAVTFEGGEVGDPTEVALVKLGDFYEIDEVKLRDDKVRLQELPFDSDRKLMTTLNQIGDRKILITKGAVDSIIKKISCFKTEDGKVELTDDHIRNIEEANRTFSENGLRVLAFAYKDIEHDGHISFDDENGLTFVGLISMMDPPRPESKTAVAQCISAGIKPVMITGDHKITASAIAREIGILDDGDKVFEGFELEKMSDEELRDIVTTTSVYARVSPEHKIRIVKAWQDLGNIVAMTGDGVNDAPALKQADIGVAMGITGTEVSKDASSMVLADDNFSTIVKAIENGRNIYNNIQNSIKFLLSGNTAGIITVLYASFMALPVPFAPVHLLFINLMTDSLPAIAIGMEKHSSNVMKDKVRNISTPILSKEFGLEMVLEGIVIGAATIGAFLIGLEYFGEAQSVTMAFATLCLGRLFHGFNSRCRESLFVKGWFTNGYVWMAFLLGAALLHMVLLLKPLAGIFEIAPLGLNEFAVVYVAAIAPLVIIQATKLIRDLVSK